MKTTILSEDTIFENKAVATIGFFDGVHRGHQFLLKHVVDLAHENGMESMAITFDKHPRQVLNADYQPQLLTTLDDKLKLLAEQVLTIAWCCRSRKSLQLCRLTTSWII